MGKRNLPSTSLDAYKKAVPEMLSEHYSKIISGLRKLKAATYEEIAAHLTLDKAQVGRRLSELERLEIIHKPGVKKPTRSGRSAYVYQLVPRMLEPEKQTAEEFFSDFQDGLYEEPAAQPKKLVQKELFSDGKQ
jgi:predicted transcriptional regulator